jgi:hypothetical protein
MTPAKQLPNVDVCSFLFLERSDMRNAYKRKMNCASWTQEDLQSAGESTSRRQTVTASSSLVVIQGTNFLQVTSHFHFSCTYMFFA